MRRAARVCSVVGCPILIEGAGHLCAAHVRKRQRAVDAGRPSSAQRGYGRQWPRIRSSYLKAHPDCVVCGQPANQVDHIVPLREGGTNDPSNLRSLCIKDHSRRTASENGGFGNPRVIIGGGA